MSRRVLLALALSWLFAYASAFRNVTVASNDARLRYAGEGWRYEETNPSVQQEHGCSAGIYRTTVLGSYVELTFVGTAVYFRTVTDRVRRDIYLVELDGTAAEVNATSEESPCAIAFGVTDLRNSRHTVRITNSSPVAPSSDNSLLAVSSFDVTVEDITIHLATTRARNGTSLPLGIIIGCTVGGLLVVLTILAILYILYDDRKRTQRVNPSDRNDILGPDFDFSYVHGPSLPPTAVNSPAGPYLLAYPASAAASPYQGNVQSITHSPYI